MNPIKYKVKLNSARFRRLCRTVTYSAFLMLSVVPLCKAWWGQVEGGLPELHTGGDAATWEVQESDLCVAAPPHSQCTGTVVCRQTNWFAGLVSACSQHGGGSVAAHLYQLQCASEETGVKLLLIVLEGVFN